MSESYGIAAISIIPIREEASHRSQQISQLLFGETYQVLEISKEWLLIKCHYDGYEGYIASNQHYPIAQLPENNFLVTSNSGAIKLGNEAFQLSMGSQIPNVKINLFDFGKLSGEIIDLSCQMHALEFSNEILESTVKSCLGTPYLWGGKSVFGTDCSGFTQIIFKLFNIKLPRDAYQQAEIGEDVYFANQCQTGDLAFFDNEEGRINHVGIVLSDNKIIHASGKVRIDLIDQNGIFNETQNKYTHKLRKLKRIINNN